MAAWLAPSSPPDGSFLYTPNLDYVGSDAFTFRFHDGAAESNVATFSLTVQAGPPEAGESSGEEVSETLNPVELAFKTRLSALAQARETTVSGLLGTLDGVVTMANGVYDSALVLARSQLTVDLGAYAGNATMYELDDFAWPDAPESEALDFPEDSEQPPLPGERPTYSGDEFNFSTNSAYQSGLADHGVDYTNAVSAAEAVYLAAISAATLSFNQTVESAVQQRFADITTANQNAATDANTPHPTINLQSAAQFAQQARQTAQALYEATVYQISPQQRHVELDDALGAAEVVGMAAYAAVRHDVARD